MDVLELPRPVINFLRNMAKEGTRYTLSWDIFGGSDSVTLTLTWKLVDDPLTMKNEILLPSSTTTTTLARATLVDDCALQLADKSSSSSPSRRSRRDECQTLTRSIRRRTKSNLNQGQTSSLERTSPLSSDPTLRSNAMQRPSYSHASSQIQRAISPLPAATQSSSLSLDRSQHRTSQRSSILNRSNRSPPTQLRRINVDQDENPWVKRFESPTKKRNDSNNEATQGKVKFKSKPDYF